MTLPDLREEYAQVMAELEQEQADIAEIENSDQDYLSELKATITEQRWASSVFAYHRSSLTPVTSSELEVFRTDVSESRAKLNRLNEKLAEIEEQKQEATAAIARANYNMHIQKESTTSAVYRLKGAAWSSLTSIMMLKGSFRRARGTPRPTPMADHEDDTQYDTTHLCLTI